MWQSGATRIMQDGIVVKGLSPKPLDLLRYHVNPRSDLTDLEKGMPWRTIQAELGKHHWIEHEGQMYQGTPYVVEPDLTSRMVFIASMMHAHLSKHNFDAKPDVTCPNDAVDNDRRHEVAHHEEIPGEHKWKKSPDDKKSTFSVKAKSIPATPETVAASTGSVRERWLVPIYQTHPSSSSSSPWGNGHYHVRWSLCSNRSLKRSKTK